MIIQERLIPSNARLQTTYSWDFQKMEVTWSAFLPLLIVACSGQGLRVEERFLQDAVSFFHAIHVTVVMNSSAPDTSIPFFSTVPAIYLAYGDRGQLEDVIGVLEGLLELNSLDVLLFWGVGQSALIEGTFAIPAMFHGSARALVPKEQPIDVRLRLNSKVMQYQQAGDYRFRLSEKYSILK